MYIYFLDTDKESVDTIHMLLPRLGEMGCTVSINPPNAELLQAISGKDPVLVLMDTRYQGKGITLARTIRKAAPGCHIAFMSAYPEDMPFCMQHLLCPSAFILKPADKDELTFLITAILQKQRGGRTEKICLNTQLYKRIVNIGDILYFSTRNKKLLCRTVEGETIFFYGTIKALAEQYGGDFIRCHSGFLANRGYILGVQKGMLQLRNCKESLPISKKYKPDVTDFLKYSSKSS